MSFSRYRDRVLLDLKKLIVENNISGKALDFGCGDGFFCENLNKEESLTDITPIDVVERKNALVEPEIYDGKTLPYLDNQFDLVYAIDVIHHSPHPIESIREICRCSGKWILIKDHVYDAAIGKLVLYLMDEIGNRRFQIESPGMYQRNWCWDDTLRSSGFTLAKRIHPAKPHLGLLGLLTNHYQYLDLWERGD